MVKATLGRQTVTARFPEAEAVYVMGEFNRWSTTATPMHQRGDGTWKAEIPAGVVPGTFAFFVWQPGVLGGRLQRGERRCDVRAFDYRSRYKAVAYEQSADALVFVIENEGVGG